MCVQLLRNAERYAAPSSAVTVQRASNETAKRHLRDPIRKSNALVAHFVFPVAYPNSGRFSGQTLSYTNRFSAPNERKTVVCGPVKAAFETPPRTIHMGSNSSVFETVKERRLSVFDL